MFKKLLIIMLLFNFGSSNNDFSKLNLNEKIFNINKYINSFKYQEDIDLYGFKDYKATLNEFIKNKGGDCEDYANAKYELYIHNGLDSNDFLMIFGYYKNQAHMVLGFKNKLLNRNWVILDNLRVRPMNIDSILREFKPIYGYNPKSLDLFSYNKETKEFVKSNKKYNYKKILK